MAKKEMPAGVQPADDFRERLRRAALDIGFSEQTGDDAELLSAGRRRLRRKRIDDRSGLLTVVEQDGVLLLEEGSAAGPVTGRRRRAARTLAVGGEVIEEIPFERLEGSKITEALEALDFKLTPRRGLRELREKGADAGPPAWFLAEGAQPSAKGSILLIVHGTFSNTDHLLEEFQATPDGQRFLKRARKHYDQVLTFDHPTLSVSPVINARDLARCFRGSKARVDVVCHSRGGLVTRWWIEAFDSAPPEQRRVVFVGSPLAGTSLAAPPKLKAALSLLANINRALGTASSALPCLWLATGLFRIVGSITSFAASTPVLDAAVALIPGLFAQSRVGNNRELASARRHAAASDGRYSSVQSNFEPDDPGWKFWRYFRNAGARAADLGADAVFDCPNDLVVDTASMTDLADEQRIGAPGAVCDFGKSLEVHHLNYFRQKKTLDFIADRFEIA